MSNRNFEHSARAWRNNVLFLDGGLEVELGQLSCIDFARCIGHQVAGFLRFGKRDDFADVFQPGEQHHPAIDSQGDSAVGWCTESKCIEQKSETVFGGLFVDPQQAKYFGLYLAVVDSDRTTACFATVDDKVVGLGTAAGRIGF